MPRKTKVVTIAREGRDKGKSYLLTEMSASRAEKWAMRAFLAMAHSGVEVPPHIMDAGIAGIAVLGLRSLQGINFEEAEPLLDEMMQCVQFLPDPRHPEVGVRPVNEDYSDVEDVATLVQLRGEVFQLHVDFSLADVLQTFQSEGTSAETISPGSSSTPTSPEASPA